MKGSLIVLALVAFSASVGAQQQRRDGNWWRSLDANYRVGYALGLLDGASQLQPRIQQHVEVTNPEPTGFFSTAGRFLRNAAVQQFLGGVTNGQLADGISQFYEDAANRLIASEDAAFVVLRRIAGHSPPDIDAMVQVLRRAARQ